MMSKQIRRLFVEKRKGFDTEARALEKELPLLLGLQNLSGLRLFHRYDVEGLTEQEWDLAKTRVFAETNADQFFEESLDLPSARFLNISYLPGQFDQCADSAEKCLQLLTNRSDAVVRSARVYAFFGALNNEEWQSLTQYLLNPVDSCLDDGTIPDTLEQRWSEAPDVPIMKGFIAANPAQLESWRKEWSLAMSEADLLFCQEHFQAEKRDPSMTEIRVLDTYWSDHCRHSTFFTAFTDISLPEDASKAYLSSLSASLAEYRDARERLYGKDSNRAECLMDLALIATKELKADNLLADLDESEEINACSIRRSIPVDRGEGGRSKEDILLMFKNETHNHPTEIEPFGGAATCLGGAIRDPLSGRATVYQAMRITGSGDPTVPLSSTLPGKLPQRRITQGAAHGFSSYGNQFGLQTGQVKEIYHEGYVAKRMEIGAVVGAVPASYVRRERPVAGDVVLLVGGATGRDGCGGATGSSKAHDASSLAECGAEVQKGNPPTERAIARLFRKHEVTRLIKRCNDFGAGGVSVAVGELADGLLINLDAVPLKYAGLNGTELAISESQERMAVVVAQDDVQAFVELAAAENLDAAPIALVNTSGENDRLQMMWRGETIVDLPRSFVDSNGAPQYATAQIAAPIDKDNYFEKPPFVCQYGEKITQTLRRCLSDLNGCSQKGLVEQFDGSIGANNVLQPYGGKTLEGESIGMAAMIPLPEGETTACSLMSFGFDPQLSSWSAYHGAIYAVLDSLAKIAAMGGDASTARLTFQEFFPRTGTDPLRWGLPLSALLGAYRAQKEMQVPSIGGKDSMSGTFNDLDVPATLVSFAVNIADATQIIGADLLPRTDSALYLLRVDRDEAGLPNFAQAKANYAYLKQLNEDGSVLAARTVGRGGIAEAIAKMSFGNEVGAQIDRTIHAKQLFSPDFGSIVLQIDSSRGFSAFDPEQDMQAELIPIGEISQDAVLKMGGESIAIESLKEVWRAPLESVFPTKSEVAEKLIDRTRNVDYPMPTASFIKQDSDHAKPSVLIPVFPGSNCEYDSARAFRHAGARIQTVVLRNRSASDLEESIAELSSALDQAQILFLPGGFSMGDEPDGSAKFIANVFHADAVREATMRLLQKRDGLAIGICNGFQALIKLGLLPYGEIRDLAPSDPTLTFNQIGRHVARYVHTRVSSLHSPWLHDLELGQIHSIPVSHGEGRFVANENWCKQLADCGQIAFQYCDEQGNATTQEPWNPNGSDWAVEGLLSRDGRILGKMGHSERTGDFVAQNIPGQKDQGLFRAGVRYFL